MVELMSEIAGSGGINVKQIAGKLLESTIKQRNEIPYNESDRFLVNAIKNKVYSKIHY